MADLWADEGGTGGGLSRTWDGGEVDEEGKEDDEEEGKRREAKCSRFRCDMN